MKLRQDIIEVLSQAQNGLKQKKLLKTLHELADKANDLTVFFNTFYVIFSNTLLVFKREPAAERLVEFVAKFSLSCLTERNEEEEDEDSSSSSDDEESSFTKLLVAKLVSMHQAKDKAVRFRICQLLAKLTAAVADDGTRHFPTSSLDSIVDAMLVRLHDKVAVTRAHAVQVLARVNDPSQADSPIVTALLWSMENDPSPDVRRAVIVHIPISCASLPVVMGRTKDINKNVRRAAFLALSEKCSIKYFTIKQRLQLLQSGLNDRCPAVKEACVRGLLRSWCMECEGDFLALLYRLDVESSPDISELALKALFDQLTDEELLTTMEGAMLPVNDETEQSSNDGATEQSKETTEKDTSSPPVHLIPFERLNTALVFYWVSLCRHFHERGANGVEQLERITPTLSQFCDYMQQFTDEILESREIQESAMEQKIDNEFIAHQLLSLLPCLDMDEVGKHKLATLVHSLAVSPHTPPSLVTPMLAVQRVVWPQESFRVEKLVEIIADIRHPGLSESATNESSLAVLSSLELTEDAPSLMKCLMVAGEMLKELDKRSINPIIITLIDSLLLPCFQNEDPQIRDLAVWSLGRACLLDVELACKHILLLVQVTQIDHENVQATAAKAIFDLFHLYGLEAFRPQAPPTQTQEETSGDTAEEPGNSTATLSQLISGDGDGDGDAEGGDGEGEDGDGPDKATQQILHLLADYLDSESVIMRGVVAEGICKLLSSGRLVSHRLLVRLLLLWYNPILEEENELREVLATFFTMYSAQNRDCRVSIAELYLPAIRTILDAPASSPIADVDISNVADFIINLSSPVLPNEVSAHDSLSFELANHLLSDGEGSDVSVVRTHCRSLSLMKLSSANKTNAADVLCLAQQLTEVLSDRTSLRFIQKVVANLQKVVTTSIGQPQASTGRGFEKEGNEEEEEVEEEEDEENKENIENSPQVNHGSPAHNPCTPCVASSQPTSPAESMRTRVAAISPGEATTTLHNTPQTKKGQRGTRHKKGKNSRTTSTRRRKQQDELLKRNTPVTPAHTKEKIQAADDDDDSDDSLVGEHSPFVRRLRRMPSQVPPIDYNIKD